MPISVFSAALVAALVGYGSTIALVLAAAAALGATPAQTASWVLAICIGKAVGSAWLSWSNRIPVVLAWSTPGAALIAATEGIGMAQAAGAFVLAGLLVLATGLIQPLGRLAQRIPDGIAGGMLAGVLLPFCMKLPAAAQAVPVLVLPVIAVFALVRLRNPALAVLVALILGIGAAFISGIASLPALSLPLPSLTFIAPAFDPGTLIGLGLPLYLVTMASQNLPGFATLRAAGYEPPVRAGLVTTGGISAVIGLFGAHTISMAAITAAICLGDDVHPDRNRRWIVGLVYAGFWVLLGLLTQPILSLLSALPTELITAIVALALLGPLMGAATHAFTPPETRFAAAITLAVTASGAAVLGIGAAFWGLMAGLAFHALERLKPR
ncbi:benzoate membrane transport protein [Gemmobacter caeni]|uniref:Benzoate membrane transport protein n=2 Tax=Gemmobacter TaxID=204456 RepID=A0A2T6AYW0_9RHOB|nr:MULTISPECIES: benzoate/H(+) symporter BenE family transporter [Gemmobacter]PTX48997.1 benzoate membrane transport protein [Gemmobacter caeni]TWI99002.1 benzoate membrane transport protein [Gemmobacter caeni]GHC31613.1 benzoate transporter [Gemmobacter nanjingensis]